MSCIVALFVFVFVFGQETNTQEQSTPACPVNETWNPTLHGLPSVCHSNGLCVGTPSGGCQCISGYVTCKEISGCVLPKDCPGTAQ
ncbi:unnamed protein product [Xylocopa violacea]|uniref:Uncharacterized protein n=1 Tax=Xylocopa violacea TaxID=135666 RepID=A0ABP1P881_XYLVO